MRQLHWGWLANGEATKQDIGTVDLHANEMLDICPVRWSPQLIGKNSRLKRVSAFVGIEPYILRARETQLNGSWKETPKLRP